MWSEAASKKSCCLIAALCLLLCGCAGKEAEETQLVSRNGAPVVQIGDAVYYWLYSADSFEPGGLRGDYSPGANAENQLIRCEDGRETVLASGPWFGPMWVLGDRLIVRNVAGESGGLTCLSPAGEVLWTLDGEGVTVRTADPERGSLICTSGWTVFSLDGEGHRTDLAEMVRYLGYEGGALYVQDCSQYEEAILWRLAWDGQWTELARVTVEYGGNSGPIITQLETAGNTAYFLYGAYDGTANVFQGGWLAAAKLDGSGCDILTGVHFDRFFLRERDGTVTLVYPAEYELVWDGETALELNVETGETAQTDGPVWFRPVGVPFADGGCIQVVKDRTGETVTLVDGIAFPETEYDGEEPEPCRKIRDIAVAGGWLWYTLEVGRYAEEWSADWRDGYARTVTQVCRIPLAGGEAQVLYEY